MFSDFQRRKYFQCEHSSMKITTVAVREIPHTYQLVKIVAQRYAKMRLKSFAKTQTLHIHGNQSSLRSKLTKIITYCNV